MDPSCCDLHARARLTHSAHLHRARIRPAEPLDAPGARPALSPGAVGSIGVWVGAGLGRGGTRTLEQPGATRLLLQFLSDQLPGTKR